MHSINSGALAENYSNFYVQASHIKLYQFVLVQEKIGVNGVSFQTVVLCIFYETPLLNIPDVTQPHRVITVYPPYSDSPCLQISPLLPPVHPILTSPEAPYPEVT